MRQIDAGDIQRFIAASVAEGLEPKTVRHLWGTVNLIWGCRSRSEVRRRNASQTEVAPQS
jgi:hypothetical protein